VSLASLLVRMRLRTMMAIFPEFASNLSPCYNLDCVYLMVLVVSGCTLCRQAL
jgi:hypothetical protein